MHEISCLSDRLGDVGYMRGPCCYQAMSKPIIVKSTVGIILCLCVLCTYHFFLLDYILLLSQHAPLHYVILHARFVLFSFMWLFVVSFS